MMTIFLDIKRPITIDFHVSRADVTLLRVVYRLSSIRVGISVCVWFGMDQLINLRGTFNKFPDFFRTGIKNCRRLLKIHYVIAIHLMRRLTNFMISASNQQLQQQLEYILLKPDCHSW